MAGRLEGRVALVVGAGSSGPGWGNGKAAAVLYALEGAKVFAVDVKKAAAEETASIIRGEKLPCETHACDVSKADQVASMVKACTTAFGRIDILHNNVGIVTAKPTVEVTEEEWDKVNAVNLKGLFLTCKHALPVMEKNEFRLDATGRKIGRGVIVNVSSIAGIRWSGVPYITYSTTKGAVIPFTRSIALEYASRGIRANAILPGLMNTPMIVEPLKDAYAGGDVNKMIETRDAQCPTGYMGDAWDVAHAALFLASDESRYVTGTEIVVDGGITAKFA